MIEAIKGPANTCMALCKCDRCSSEVALNALHNDKSGRMHNAKARKLTLKEPGMVNKILVDRGWNVGPRGILCPACVSKKREVKPMTNNVQPLREPTREQKRQIVAMLESSYDIEKGRYKGAETDLTVAEVIGGGVMFGWVAQVREDMFGPDGGNDEMGKIEVDLKQWHADMVKVSAEVHSALNDMTVKLREFNDHKGKAADFLKRIEAIKVAVGPKAARA